MAGSQESNRRKRCTPRGLIATLALLALIATACGSVADDTASADEAAGDDAVAEVVEEQSDDAAGVDAEAAPAPDTTSPQAETPSVEVLSFALQASEELSYSFEQGLALQANVEELGLVLDLAPDAPLSVGAIDGNSSTVNTDVGVFLSEAFDSFGLDPSLFGLDLDDAEIDVWTVDNDIVIDLSGAIASYGSLDPTLGTELAVFADGPVAIDLEELAELGDFGETNATTLIEEFGQGASITDPSLLIESLRTIDVLEFAGTETFEGTPVDVYEAVVPVADFFDAVDLDIEGQLDQFDGFDVLGTPGAPGLLEGLGDLGEVTVDLVVMLDEQGLVRRLVSTIDFGAAANASDPLDVVVETWQNFDNYGEDTGITLPDAEDRTAEIAALLSEI